MSTERCLFHEETDDSPQFTTVTIYDLEKCSDDIIDLVEDEPHSRDTRRERGETEDLEDDNLSENDQLALMRRNRISV